MTRDEISAVVRDRLVNKVPVDNNSLAKEFSITRAEAWQLMVDGIVDIAKDKADSET